MQVIVVLQINYVININNNNIAFLLAISDLTN